MAWYSVTAREREFTFDFFGRIIVTFYELPVDLTTFLAPGMRLTLLRQLLHDNSDLIRHVSVDVAKKSRRNDRYSPERDACIVDVSV